MDIIRRGAWVLLALALGCSDRAVNDATVNADGARSCGVAPTAPECGDLCQKVCARLIQCKVGWAATCQQACNKAYSCPGETVGQDAAICSSALGQVQSYTCGQLCAWTNQSGTVAAWGGSC